MTFLMVCPLFNQSNAFGNYWEGGGGGRPGVKDKDYASFVVIDKKSHLIFW